MNEKIKKLIHLVTMIIAVIAVVIFAVFHAVVALDTQYGSLLMIAYVLMFIWAICRVIILIKEYRRL